MAFLCASVASFNVTWMSESCVAFPERLRRFLRAPAGGASILLLASLAGLVPANTPWAAAYAAPITMPARISFPGDAASSDIGTWISDGLMALFFVAVILEIKKETVDRHLSSARGWAIPVATDAAFTLAIPDDALGIVVITLIAANRHQVGTLWVYAAGCAPLWRALLESGLHPIFAGVVTGVEASSGTVQSLPESWSGSILDGKSL